MLRNANNRIVRIRLCKSPSVDDLGVVNGGTNNGANHNEAIDTSSYQAMVKSLQRSFPLLTIAMAQNVLDAEYEIEAVVPNKADAWRLSAHRQAPTRADKVVLHLQYACVFAMVGILFHTKLEESVGSMWTLTQCMDEMRRLATLLGEYVR